MKLKRTIAEKVFYIHKCPVLAYKTYIFSASISQSMQTGKESGCLFLRFCLFDQEVILSVQKSRKYTFRKGRM